MSTRIGMLLLSLLLAGPVFAAAPGQTDYPAQRRAAMGLVKAGDHAGALEAFLAMAQQATLENQKSDALEQAAMCAKQLEQPERALELAKQIPDVHHAAMVQMRLLQQARQHAGVIEQFGSVDLAAWPAGFAGEAAYSRGSAHKALGDGDAAVADLRMALALLPSTRLRAEAGLALGEHYRSHDEPDKALAIYADVQTQERDRDGHGWAYYTSTIGVAALHTQAARFEDAAGTLDAVDLPSRGYWRVALLMARGALEAARGDAAAAIDTYRQALADPKIAATQKAACEKRLEALTPGGSGS